MDTKRHSNALLGGSKILLFLGKGAHKHSEKLRKTNIMLGLPFCKYSSTNFEFCILDCLSIINNLILNRMHSKYVRVYVGVCVYAFAVVIVYVIS